MSAAVVLAAEPNLEGVPWWVSLIVVPILGVLLEYLRRKLKVEAPAEPRGRHGIAPAEATAANTPATPGPNASADEKMVFAQQLITEITTSRDQARRELAAFKLEADATIGRLQTRLREQDVYIARLQGVLDRLAPPSPPTQHPR